MRVLICGSREWADGGAIYQKLAQLHDGKNVVIVIEGECRGADVLGRQAAEQLRIPVLAFPAEWKKYGRSAGPIRNAQMLREGKPAVVLAFHDDLAHSAGTKDMVERAKKAGLKVWVSSLGWI